jgi:hypothetical protein
LSEEGLIDIMHHRAGLNQGLSKIVQANFDIDIVVPRVKVNIPDNIGYA